MDVKKIIMPDGKMRTFYCGDDQTWLEIITKVVLPVWQDYCNDHWIDYSNHESMWSFEKRTKAFLDRIAWLILKDDAGGNIETSYKAMVHKVREIPVSECPAEISDMIYSQRSQPTDNTEEDIRFELFLDRLDEKDKRPKKPLKKSNKETRFNRISKIRKAHPDAKMTWCLVNAQNSFYYDGDEYEIPDNTSGYDVDGINMDAMDRILIVDDGGELMYYDQNVLPIE